MAGFTDPFGGRTLNPADVAYRALVLTAPLATQWPAFATAETVLAAAMNVTAITPPAPINLPDARQATPGEQVVFYNSAGSVLTVNDAAGNPVASIPPGERRLIVLTSTVSAAGAWITTLLGVGTGTLDIAGAAGAGLKAIGTTLNVAFPVVNVSSSRDITDADRDLVIVWDGGAGTLSLPEAGTYPDIGFEVRNQGTGALTVAGAGGQLIDGSTSIIFNSGESAAIRAAGTSWHTVGRGRNAQFNFTQLQKTITGGTVTLSLTEAANVVQTYTGALVSNVEVVLPSVVQVYYVSNQTTGAFNVLFRNPGVGGASVSVPQGQNAILFSDGTNVINASTTVAGITSITFAAGSAANPSVQIGAVTTGFFSPSSGQVAFSSNGTQTFAMDGSGALAALNGNVRVGATSAVGTALFDARRPAGQIAGLQVGSGASPRLFVGADGSAESGTDAGSQLVVQTYTDGGVLKETPLSISRATGVTTMKSALDLSALGRIEQFIGDGVARDGYLLLSGALVSRTTYATLWTYAQTTTPVSEAAWSGGQSGRFSVGDGATTFRLPDLRGVFLRGLDLGRGLDAGRAWGTFQDHANVSHTHGITDPGHVHGVSDPGHAHSVSDPGHAHGVSDPGHLHGRGEYAGDNTVDVGGPASTAKYRVNGLGQLPSGTDGAFTGISINGAGTGIGIFGAFTGIGIAGAFTGISTQANGGADGHPRNQAYPIYIRY